MTRRQLTPDDWIAAGLRALAHGGPAALRAEAIARDLGATKGSFYWHFNDLGAYKVAILGYWQQHATQAIIDAVDAVDDPLARLEALIVLASAAPPEFGGHLAEPAIRDWARTDPLASRAVMAVDCRRLDYLTAQLGHLGADARQRARLIYAAHLGLALLSPLTGDRAADDLRLLLHAITGTAATAG